MPATISSTSAKSPSAAKTVLLSGFVAGTMDILAAILVYSMIMQKVTALQILHGIAAGVFGKDIVGNSTTMAFIGLVFHYMIAFSFAIGHFLVYPYIPFFAQV